MKYNPDLHNRHSIRLCNWNYSNTGAYFITICCQDRINYFGEIVNKEMVFNEYGDVAYKEWKKLPVRYPGISFDIFQIMPNHIHGIIQIQNTNVGATLAVALDAPDVPGAVVVPDVPVVVDAPDAPGATVAPRATARVAPTGGIAGVAAPGAIATSGATARVARTTVGRIVGAYKSLVFKKCLEISNLKNCILGKLWQRNYYEHIIRNEEEYAKIAEYIQNNPILWVKDCFKGKSGRRAKVGA